MWLDARRFCVAIAILIGLAHPAGAQLSGTWRLDNSRSNGVGPNVGLVMVIAQRGDTVTIERRYRLPQGPVVVLDTMPITGVVGPYVFRAPSGVEGRGVRTVKALSAGAGLEVADSVLIDTPSGPAPRWTTQTWTVDSTAGTLTQDVTLRVPFISTPVKNVFVREKQ
jgi:hypothetical protein